VILWDRITGYRKHNVWSCVVYNFGRFCMYCMSICLSDDLSKAFTKKVNICISGVSQENTGQVRLWMSSGQGQSHMTENVQNAHSRNVNFHRPWPWPDDLHIRTSPVMPGDLEIQRMCKYELPTLRLSKVIVWQTLRVVTSSHVTQMPVTPFDPP